MAVRPNQKKVTSVSMPSRPSFVYGSFPPSARQDTRIKPSKPSERDYGKQAPTQPPFGNTSMTGRS